MTSTSSLYPVQTQRVPVNGIEINVATAGHGPAVLLLHGWPHTWQLWTHLIPALVAAQHRVLAPDLRGQGASTRAATGYDAATLATDAAALLAALDEPEAARSASSGKSLPPLSSAQACERCPAVANPRWSARSPRSPAHVGAQPSRSWVIWLEVGLSSPMNALR